MNGETLIRDYLTEIAKRDLDGRYVYPKPDVEHRIAEEIHARTGVPANQNGLVKHDGELFPKQAVSSDPDKFVDSTLTALDEHVLALKKASPKEFDVAFKNLGKTDAKSWGDQISFRVRFRAKTSAS